MCGQLRVRPPVVWEGPGSRRACGTVAARPRGRPPWLARSSWITVLYVLLRAPAERARGQARSVFSAGILWSVNKQMKFVEEQIGRMGKLFWSRESSKN